MEKINKYNYEIFFIDHFDGNLTPDQTAELFQFLNENPDLKDEFDNFESIPITIAQETFPLKADLKKHPSELVSDSSFEEFCVAYAENDLNDEEKESLFEFAQKNNLQNIVEKYSTLKLTASNEAYEEKDGLKKLIIDNEEEINENSIEEYAIAYHEGDLNEGVKKTVEDFIKSKKSYANLLSNYKKTFLLPEKIVFKQKSGLKKFSIITFSKRVVPYATAAAILLFFVLLFSVNKMGENNLSTITEIDKKPVVKEEVKAEPEIENVQKEPIKIIEENKTTKVPQKEKVEQQKKNEILPAYNKQIITPIKKSSPIISFEGKIQIASLVNQPKKAKNVAFKQDAEFEAIIAQSQSPQKKDEKYYKIGELVADRFKKDVLKTNDERFSLWQVAQAGARGLSKLTGKEYKVETGLDENGNVALMAFNSENFEYSRTKK